MISSTKKMALFALCIGFLTVSCQKDEVPVKENNPTLNLKVQKKSTHFNADISNLPALKPFGEEIRMSENIKDALSTNLYEPSECGPTEFAYVQNHYIGLVAQDLFALFDNDTVVNQVFNTYLTLATYGALLDQTEQYFGKNGKYTRFMIKRQRQLEKFWNMPNEITVLGQHTASLKDRELLADIYELVGLNINSREEAYEAADFILLVNSLSPSIPENPFFALDGFASSGNFIVIGDGIVSMLSDTGLNPKIVWTGILSHEWAHQIQFNHYADWYPQGSLVRYTELEADFMAAYFMTHKRGATYNWKRVEEFFKLYFQIGDCAFDSEAHHGTPLQRLDATRLGYELANGAQKQGHILSAQKLHEYFVANFEDLVD